MKDTDINYTKYSFEYHLYPDEESLSNTGMTSFLNLLSTMATKDDFVGIYVWQPYSFTIGSKNKQIFLIDTQKVSKE